MRLFKIVLDYACLKDYINRILFMKTDLSQAQITKYQNDGFIHIPGFLSPAEVAELKGAVVETARAMGKKKVAGEGADWRNRTAFTTRSSPSASISGRSTTP